MPSTSRKRSNARGSTRNPRLASKNGGANLGWYSAQTTLRSAFDYLPVTALPLVNDKVVLGKAIAVSLLESLSMAGLLNPVGP